MGSTVLMHRLHCPIRRTYSASSSVAPPPPIVAAPPVAAAGALSLPVPSSPAPGSPTVSAASSGSDSGGVNPDIVALQRECDLARGRYSAATVEIEHLQDSLQAVEVARGAAEGEVRAARDAASDAHARAFGEFRS